MVKSFFSINWNSSTTIAEGTEMGDMPDNHVLKVAFLPWVTPGHMIPMVDVARLFAKHGVDVTIITTPANALKFQKTIDDDLTSGHSIRCCNVPFPAAKVGLPDGIENFRDTKSPDMDPKVYFGLLLIQAQMENTIEELKPDCLVTDMFYPWTLEVAKRLGIPRLYFNGSSYFALSAEECIESSGVHKSVASDSAPFSIPGFPHKIEMMKSQLPAWVQTEHPVSKIMDETKQGLHRSYGAVMNSFTALEGPYEELFKSIFGIKAWSIGPVSLWINQGGQIKECRGQNHTTVETQDLLSWLDSKQHDSVLYVSFGSLTKFPLAQLVEIAHGLESSGHNFVWVFRKKNEDEDTDGVLEAFEERMKASKQGYVLKGWAPQLLIFDQPAIGGFLTHCGWNSLLEGIAAGLPVLTWPLFADQFYNEKYLTEVLKIGVGVGSKKSDSIHHLDKELITREQLAKTVAVLMGDGEHAQEMRTNVRKLSSEVKKAIQHDGSSQANLNALIEELKSLKAHRR